MIIIFVITVIKYDLELHKTSLHYFHVLEHFILQDPLRLDYLDELLSIFYICRLIRCSLHALHFCCAQTEIVFKSLRVIQSVCRVSFLLFVT